MQRSNSHWVGCSIVLIGTFLVPGLVAGDKTGVGPSAISVPKGPGSIEGLGESFQPALNSGTARYSVSLKVPKGTANHGPSLGLQYEGGGGNGALGFGWELSPGCIQRRSDRGIPTYGQALGISRQDTFLAPDKEELVPNREGFYLSRTEGAFVRYRQMGGHWEATQPDGRKQVYGLSPEARIEDGSTGRVYAWLLERDTDLDGNTVVYSYTSHAGEQNLNQKYLRLIRYGPGAPLWTNYHFVAFKYEERSDWFEDARAGFIVRTGHRLRQVIVGTQGPELAGHLHGDFDADGRTDALVRRFELSYWPYAGTNTVFSLLGSVREVGCDGKTALPSLSFGYGVCHPPEDVNAAARLLTSFNEPPIGPDNPRVELVDLNGDGLPDLLETGGSQHRAYLNQGEQVQTGQRGIRWGAATEVDAGSGDAALYELSAAETHLGDMDGDGLADLAHRASPDRVFYFPNRGRLGWGERRNLPVGGDGPPAPFGVSDARTADFDFDKRMDWLQGDGSQYRIWFNLGTKGVSEPFTTSAERVFNLALEAVHVADLNGDRVPDLAQIWTTGVEVTAGLGYGRFDSAHWMTVEPILDSEQVKRARLVDITGDGLDDLVLEQAAPGELWYWINQGNYTLAARQVISGMPTGISPTAVVRWADLTGNGTTDLVYADSAWQPVLQIVDLGEVLGYQPGNNTLVAITNGLGRITLIAYSSSTTYALEDATAGRPWPDVLPFPVSVVAAVTNLDSLGHQYVTRYAYHDGYYDPEEKQFRGFAKAEQIEVGDAMAPTLVSRSEFDTGRTWRALKGRLRRLTAAQDDGGVFTDAFTSWTEPPVTLYTGTNGIAVQYAHPVGQATLIKELGQGTERRLESESDYDSYGNLIRQADYGIVQAGNRSAVDDERIIRTWYIVDTNAWILHLPQRREVQDEQANVITRTQYFYDDETFSGANAGQVTLGHLTLQREWPDPANASVYIDTARTQYDRYGNPVRLLDPLAKAPDGVADLSHGHLHEMGYDDRFHNYLVSETIQLGGGSEPLVHRATYDEGLGVITGTIDSNDQTTLFGYDTLGRLTSILKPGDSPGFPTLEYEYVLAAPVGDAGLVNYVETRQLDQPPSDATATNRLDRYHLSRQYVDGLGRGLLTKEEAEPAFGSTAPRVVVIGATQYNARHKPALALNPWFTLKRGSLADQLAYEDIEAKGWEGQFHQDGELVSLNLAKAHATRTVYNATLRPIQVTHPDATFGRWIYEPLLVKTFDQNDTDPTSSDHDTPTVRHHDGLGRLVQVDEVTRLHDDGTPGNELNSWATRYRYDLNDQLLTMTDSQNNVRSYSYDSLKRKIALDDPDRGPMRYVYDEASNLIESTDAKQQQITYTYDGANRILTETYHDGQPLPAWRPKGRNITAAVIYHYDQPCQDLAQGDNTVATARNVKGMLAWVEDLSGEEHTSYDERGRVEWLIKRIPEAGLLSSLNARCPVPLVSYRTAFSYNPLDQVVTLIYPDGDLLRYEYNARNLVQRIPGGPSGSIIAFILYLPSAQIGQVDYGNDVRTTYRYDSRLRLSKLLTVSQSETLKHELINFQYHFDAVSNIRTILDQRPASAVPPRDPNRNTQSFSYDDRHRLTQVRYSFAVPSAPLQNDAEVDYRYDRIGNMLAQTSTLEHLERGQPVANLGEMESGGIAGCWGRVARTSKDPPGPHALAAIRSAPLKTRFFEYDSNGNMTRCDGLTCEWDFKDRLVRVEDESMRATYTYDYKHRRILKQVWPKNTTNSPGSTAFQPWTVAYVNKFFEIREHDAPTKYVWDGKVRVARVTCSLNANLRIQRLRVWTGWNLVSLAVTATKALQQLAGSSPSVLEILLCRRWEPAAWNWVSVSAEDTLKAGSVLWLRANTNASLTVTGTYSEAPTNTLTSVDGFLPSFGLTPRELSSGVGNQPGLFLWYFDAQMGRWRYKFPLALTAPSELPLYLRPGEVLFIRADIPTILQERDIAIGVCFYHQDHLGSTSVTTDQNGHTLRSTTYYPFGSERIGTGRAPEIASYGFTQKERDPETGLSYFEHRFLNTAIGRFTRVEPLAASPPGDWRQDPQLFAFYAYAINSPLVNIDPTGQTVVLSGTSSYIKKVVKALKQLDPSAKIDKQRRVTFDSSKSTQHHYFGHRLLQQMVTSQRTATIVKTTEGNSARPGSPNQPDTPNDWNDATKMGTDATVSWNQDSDPTIPTVDPGSINNWSMQHRPTFIGLAHELIHASHIQQGMLKLGGTHWQGQDDSTHLDIAEEAFTVGPKGFNVGNQISENLIRGENGLAARAFY